MKFGVMDGVLECSHDNAAFARAKQLGFEGIEINLKIAQLRNAADDRARLLKDLAAHHGLAMPSTVLGEHNSGGLATWWRGPDAEEEIRLAIDFTAAIGASMLLVPFFFINEPKGKTHRQAVADRIKPLAAYAARHGVWFAFEGVNHAADMVEMARQIGSDHFGVYYDVANTTWCDRDAPAEIRALGSLLRQAHAKEAKVFTGDARLGTGRVDHAACAVALKAIGYDRWIVLETPGGSDAEITGDLAFARKTYGL